jgi:hypothetical protein
MRGKILCPICKVHALFFANEADGTSPLEARVEREFAEARMFQHVLEAHPSATGRVPIQLKLAYAKHRKKVEAWSSLSAPEPSGAAERGPAAAEAQALKAAPRAQGARSAARASPPPGAARGRSSGRGKAPSRTRSK